MIKLLIMLCVLSQIKEITPDKKLEIEIITKQTQEYNVLTKNEPISLTVEGPTYLRIYTRIIWPNQKKGQEIYKLILHENELDEEILTFETERSTVTKDEKGRSVSKWRSFYLDVPEGLNTYKLMHWSSPKDTILLKFAYESPKEWVDIPATSYSAILEAAEEEKIIKYYEATKVKKVTCAVNGPMKIKVVARLNYDKTMMGEHSYTVLIDDNGKTDTHTLHCYKSEVVQYVNKKDLIPSNAQSFYISVEKGRHVLQFTLSGTVAESAALRFLTEQ
jgi:hypothetical protein